MNTWINHARYPTITKMKWFDRKFVFDLPDSMYPNVVERLRGTPGRAEELVLGLDSSTLTERHGQSWSIQENVGHLLDLEPLWSGRVDDLFSNPEYQNRPKVLFFRSHHPE